MESKAEGEWILDELSSGPLLFPHQGENMSRRKPEIKFRKGVGEAAVYFELFS